MAESKQTKDPAQIQRTTPGYGKMLADTMTAVGLSNDDFDEKGLQGAQVWRIKKGDAPIKAAENLRLAILKRRPGLNLSPPSIPSEGPEHFEWAQLGARLLAVDPEGFRDRLEQLRKIVAGAESDAEFMDEIGAGGGGEQS